ncbi:MAG: efflux RND transporter periplasmic adaptor subunit [Candidatus Eremiobacteraeota bacterium]|nr:efflux RND transporter periplasmic adaptor subunit [Candidatus Eremiobacteraeota bacterium]
MKKKLIILVVVLFLGAAAYFIISQMNKSKGKIEYLTAKVTKGSIITQVSTTGELQPVTKVDIGAQVSGKITALYVDYNSRVKKGQPIAMIDTSIYRSKVTLGTADLRQAQANYSQALSGYENALLNVTVASHEIETARSDVKSSEIAILKARDEERSKKAEVESAQAKMKNSLAQQNRYRALYAKNYTSQTDKEKMETDYSMDKASYDASQARYKNALDSIDSAKASLELSLSKFRTQEAKKLSQEAQAASSKAQAESAAAKVQSAQAALKESQINLDYCTIRSPIDGIVISKEVEAGQTVQASFQTPKLLTIARDLRQMQINADVDEADIARVKLGQKVQFTVEAYQFENFSGKVFQVRSSKSNQGVVTYQVIIRTDNRDLKLKPGMTATVNIHTSQVDDVIKVPASALRFKPDSIANFPYPAGYVKKSQEAAQEGEKGGKTSREVWVLGSDNKPRPEKIELGQGDRKFVEMTAGSLKEGDSLITGARQDSKAPEGTYK